MRIGNVATIIAHGFPDIFGCAVESTESANQLASELSFICALRGLAKDFDCLSELGRTYGLCTRTR